MSVRKRIARDIEDIIDINYKKVLKKAKIRYRYEKEFYLFKAYKGSDMWCVDSHISNKEYIEEHWIFDEKIGKWVNIVE